MKIKPEDFDILGVLAFTSIAGIALYGLINVNPLPKWTLFYLLFVGIIGLTIDGTIVDIIFLRKRGNKL